MEGYTNDFVIVNNKYKKKETGADVAIKRKSISKVDFVFVELSKQSNFIHFRLLTRKRGKDYKVLNKDVLCSNKNFSKNRHPSLATPTMYKVKERAIFYGKIFEPLIPLLGEYQTRRLTMAFSSTVNGYNLMEDRNYFNCTISFY